MATIVKEGLTFDDVLLIPQKSEILPSQIDTKTKLTKDIMNVVNQVSDGVKGSTGVDLAKMLKDFVSEDKEVEFTDNENLGTPEPADYREF